MTTDVERLAEAANLLGYTCNPEDIEDPELDVLPVANALATRDAEITALHQEIEHLRGLFFLLDGDPHANHVRELIKTLEARITKYAEAVTTIYQERDAARAEVERLREEVKCTESYERRF